MLYREPVQIAQSITDVVTRSKPSSLAAAFSIDVIKSF